MIVWLVLALLVVVTGPADAAGSIDKSSKTGGDPRCGGQALDACTQQRVEALRRLSAELKQAAAQQPASAPSDPKAREELARYDRWLTRKSEQTAKLASEGQRALTAPKDMQEMQMSFNLQYLQLQNQMQNESRQFSMVSNIMKTKHDTVKNSISNIR